MGIDCPIKCAWFDIRCRRRTTESTLLLYLGWMVFSRIRFLKSWHRAGAFSIAIPVCYASHFLRHVSHAFCAFYSLKSLLWIRPECCINHRISTSWQNISRLLSRVKIGRDLWEIVSPLHRDAHATVPKTMRDYSRSERGRFRCTFPHESKILWLKVDGKLEKYNVINIP